MKKIMKLFVCVAAAAMALASCQKNEIDSPVNEGVKFTINAGITETKTVITDNGNGTYTPSWDGTEELAVLFDLPNKDTKDSHAKKFTNETGEGATAKFSATVEDVDENGTLYAVYPYAAFGRGFDGGIARLDLKNEQKPTATSFDPSCDILVAKPYDYAVVDGAVEVDPLYFTRVMSVLKVNLLSDVESIQNDYVETIKFSTGGIYITGYAKVSVENPEFVGEWTTEYDYVTASYDSESVSVNGTNKSVYFVVAPVTIPVEKELTFTIKTSKYTITKTIKANEHPEMEFSAGNVSVINLNIKEEDIPTSGGNDSEKYYEKVTSEPDDWSGKYLVVFGNNAHATLSSNNKDFVSTIEVSINDDRIPAYDEYEKAVMTVTKSGEKYNMTYPDGKYFSMAHNISASSDTPFDLEFTYTDDGVKIIGYVIAKSAYYILYHNSNNGNYYRCYVDKNGQNGYALPILYRLSEGNNGSETPEPEPKTLVSIAVAGQTTTYTVGDTFKFDGTVTATYDDESTAPVTPTSVSKPDMNTVGTQDITVSYTEGEVTAETTYTITVNEAPAGPIVATIEEFLAAEESETVWYQLTGTVSNISNTQYGNFNLVDATGTVYVYGLTATKVTSNDQSFVSIGLKEGDVVTLIGTRAVHNNNPEVGGPAYYVSHQHVSATPSISCKDNVVTITAATGATIYYTTDGTTPTTESSEYTASFGITEDTTVKAIAVEEGKLTSAVAEANCTWVDPNAGSGDDKYYVKVDSSQNDWSGTYLITATASSGNVTGLVAFSSMNAYNSNSYGKYTKIEEAETGKILSDSSVDSYKVVIEKTSNGYSIKFGEYYLAKTSKSNDIKATKNFTAKECEWTFNGLKIVNVSKTSYNIQWNNNKTQERFACYKNTQKDVVLYKLEN